GRKLDGVRDEIEQDLLKSFGVGCHENFVRRRRDREREALRFGLERAQALNLRKQRTHSNGDELQRPRELVLLRGENVVDQTREICGGALDLAQIQRLFRSDGSANAELQELGVTGNGVERRAKLVTHHPQKERLRAVGVLGFLA